MKTPDPIFSTEAIGVLAATIITNAVILFKLDLSDERQAALVALINGAVAVAIMLHGAFVRGKRNERVGAESAAVAATPLILEPSVPEPGDGFGHEHDEPGPTPPQG